MIRSQGRTYTDNCNTRALRVKKLSTAWLNTNIKNSDLASLTGYVERINIEVTEQCEWHVYDLAGLHDFIFEHEISRKLVRRPRQRCLWISFVSAMK